MADLAWGNREEYQWLIDATANARLDFFRTLGQPDHNVWHPTAVPVDPGGPCWPTRPAWRRIRAGKQTIISSSGLTDPFDNAGEPNIGYAVEVAMATADEIPEQLHPSWLLDLAVGVSNQASVDRRFNLRAAKFGVFLFGAPGDPASYGDWIDRSGTLGFLIGLPIPGVETTIKLPAGNAVFLMAKLLSPNEYEFVATRGLEGARTLVERFGQDGNGHLSSLKRASVV
jgi:hypothetical protein